MKTGPELLLDWIARRGFKQYEAAEFLGFDEAVLSKFVCGTQRPGLDNAVKIENLTGIPARTWASTKLDNGADEPATAGGGRGRK